jgi:hypothetical protein
MRKENSSLLLYKNIKSCAIPDTETRMLVCMCAYFLMDACGIQSPDIFPCMMSVGEQYSLYQGWSLYRVFQIIDEVTFSENCYINMRRIVTISHTGISRE